MSSPVVPGSSSSKRTVALVLGGAFALVICSLFCCGAALIVQGLSAQDDAQGPASSSSRAKGATSAKGGAALGVPQGDAPKAGATPADAPLAPTTYERAQIDRTIAQDPKFAASMKTLTTATEGLLTRLMAQSGVPELSMFDRLDRKGLKAIQDTQELLQRSLGPKIITAHVVRLSDAGDVFDLHAYIARADDPKDPRQLRVELSVTIDRKVASDGLRIIAWSAQRVMRQGEDARAVEQWPAYEGHPAPNEQADLALMGAHYQDLSPRLRKAGCARELELELKRTSDYVSLMKGSARDKAWFERQMEWVKPNCDAIRRLRSRGFSQQASYTAATLQRAAQTELLWLTNGMFERMGSIAIEHKTRRRSSQLSYHKATFVFLGRRLKDSSLDWYLYRVSGDWR